MEESVESYKRSPRRASGPSRSRQLELSGALLYNCLKNANIQSIRELVQEERKRNAGRPKNFGRKKSLNEIKEILHKMGLSLGMKFDEHGRIIWPPLPSQTRTADFGGNRGPVGARRTHSCDIATLDRNSDVSRHIAVQLYVTS